MRLALPLAFAASLHAFAQSTRYPDFVAEAGLVLVSVTALDRNGALISDLRREDFALEDNGKPRSIENMWREDSTPLSIGLIAGTSGSQLRVIPKHQRTLSQFLQQVLRAQDQALLVSVPADARMVIDVTHSISELQGGVQRLNRNPFAEPQFGDPCRTRTFRDREYPACATAIWSAVFDTSNLRMRQIEGRKATIVLSDGMDFGSRHSLTDAIEAAQRAGTPVYTIYTGSFPVAMGRGKSPMSRLAKETGGRAYSSSDDSGSAKIFDEIETELRNTYILAFTLPPDARDGKFHKLKVTTKRRGVAIHTRSGYFADK